MRTGRRALRYLLPLAGGALVGCSLPPLAPWPLGVVGLGVVVACLAGRRGRGRAATGMLAGIGQFSISLAWATQFSEPGYAVLVLLESAILALAVVLVPPRGPLRLPAAAAAVTLAEWARDSWPFGGLPLGSAALGQVGGPLQFTARIGGPLLVVFVAALAGGAIADVVVLTALRLGERRSGVPAGAPRRRGGVGAAASSLVAAACLVGGGVAAGTSVVASTAAAASGRGSGRTVQIAAVQGGGKRGLNQLQVPPAKVFRAALRETRAVSGHPQLILWPEDVVSMGTTPFRGSSVERLLAGVARRRHATLVVGVTQDVGKTRFLNEVVAFGPGGHVVATFEKVHRVPFGEYVPYRGLFRHFANLSDVPRDAIPGHGSGMIRTPAGRFAVLVSYEVFFAARGRSGVRAGGEIILVPTNTSSYSSSQAPSQEIAASRLQALEEGRYLVQVAPTGYSAVISPSGTVLVRTGLSEPAVIERRVPYVTATTPFEQFGELPVLVGCAALLALAWALSLSEGAPLRRSR